MYLAPQNIPSAIVLTLGNKVAVYLHCIVDLEDHRVNPKLLKLLLCGCSIDDVPVFIYYRLVSHLFTVFEMLPGPHFDLNIITQLLRCAVCIDCCFSLS